MAFFVLGNGWQIFNRKCASPRGGIWCGKTNFQDTADEGFLRVGETVAPLYVDQSRDALSADKTVFQEITDDLEEIVLGVILNSIHTHHYEGFFFPLHLVCLLQKI
jgi:hypothetical protein